MTTDPDFLGSLVRAASERAVAGLVSPPIVHLNRPDEAWYPGGTFSPWTGIPVQGHRRCVLAGARPPREVDYATGCAMPIRPAVIQRVGPFDRELFVPTSLGYHDVSDEPRGAALRIYYGTRNLIEVMRKHAPWYKWFSFGVNFVPRWVGFWASPAT